MSDSDSSFSDAGSLSDVEPVEDFEPMSEPSAADAGASSGGFSGKPISPEADRSVEPPVPASGDGSNDNESQDDDAAEGEDESDNRDWFAVLKGVFDAAELSATNQQRFLEGLSEEKYEPGYHIVRQGEIGDSFYIIMEGDAVVREDPKRAGDKPRDLVTLHAGAHFGEFSVILEQARIASVVAVGAVTCKAMTKANFEELNKTEPAIKKIITGLVEETERTRYKREAVRSKAGTRKKVYVTGNPKLKVTDTVTHSKDDSGMKRINNYVLRRKLGQGSFGTVWLGEDTTAASGAALEDTYVAIKALDKLRLRKKRLGITDEELMREVAVMKLLRHENIVSLIEVMEDKDPTSNRDILYMVQEFMANGSIMEEEEYQDPLDPELARQYFRDVLRGLEYLHFQRVSHRDIKPSNVLINIDKDNPQAKLADFGVSAVLPDDSNLLKDPQGTPAYMAPELFDEEIGDKGYDGFYADVYSLGATLYNLVVGRPPFLANSYAELTKMVEEQGVSIPAKISSHSLRHLLRAMLEKDPVKRLTLSQIMSHDWVTVEGSEPINATDYVRVTKMAAGGGMGGSATGGGSRTPGILQRLDSQSKGIASRMASGAGRVVRGSRRTRRASLHRSDTTQESIDAAVEAAKLASVDGDGLDASDSSSRAPASLMALHSHRSNRKLSETARQAQRNHLESLQRKRFQLLASLDISDYDKDQMLEHQRLPIHGSRAHVTIEEIVIDDTPHQMKPVLHEAGSMRAAAAVAAATEDINDISHSSHEAGSAHGSLANGKGGSPMPGQKLPGGSFMFRASSVRTDEDDGGASFGQRGRSNSGQGSVGSRAVGNFEGRRMLVSDRTQSSVDLGAALYGYSGSVIGGEGRSGSRGYFRSNDSPGVGNGSVGSSFTYRNSKHGFRGRLESNGSEASDDEDSPLLGIEVAGHALVSALSRSYSMRYMFGNVMVGARLRSYSGLDGSDGLFSDGASQASLRGITGLANRQHAAGAGSSVKPRPRRRSKGFMAERRYSAPAVTSLQPSALALLLAAENGLAIGRPKALARDEVAFPYSKVPFSPTHVLEAVSPVTAQLKPNRLPSRRAMVSRASRPWIRPQPSFVMAPLARAPTLVENEWIPPITPMVHSPIESTSRPVSPGPLPPRARAQPTEPVPEMSSNHRQPDHLDSLLDGIGDVQEVDEVHVIDEEDQEGRSAFNSGHVGSDIGDSSTEASAEALSNVGTEAVERTQGAPPTRPSSKASKGSMLGATKSLANILKGSKGELLRSQEAEKAASRDALAAGAAGQETSIMLMEDGSASSTYRGLHAAGVGSGMRRSGSMPGQSGAGHAAVMRASMAMARQITANPPAAAAAAPPVSRSPPVGPSPRYKDKHMDGDAASIWTTAVRALPAPARRLIRRRSVGMPPLPLMRHRTAGIGQYRGGSSMHRSVPGFSASSAAPSMHRLPGMTPPPLPGMCGVEEQSSSSSHSNSGSSLTRTGSIRDAPPGTSFKGRTLTRQADFLMVTENVGTTERGEKVKKAVIFRSKGDSGLSIATTNMDKKSLLKAYNKASRRSLLRAQSSAGSMDSDKPSLASSSLGYLDSTQLGVQTIEMSDSDSDSDDLGLDEGVVNIVKVGSEDGSDADDDGGKGLTRMGSRSKQALRMRINPTVTEGEAEDDSDDSDDSDYSDLMEDDASATEGGGGLKDVTDILDDVLGLNEETVVKIDDELEAFSDADLDSDNDDDVADKIVSVDSGSLRSPPSTPLSSGRRLMAFGSPPSGSLGPSAGGGTKSGSAPGYAGVDIARAHMSQANPILQLTMASAEVQGKRSTMEDRSIALVSVGAALGDEIGPDSAAGVSAVPADSAAAQGGSDARTTTVRKAPATSYFGVYDGHNGQECSQALQDSLHLAVWEAVRSRVDSKGVAEGLREAFLAVDDDYTLGSVEKEKQNAGKYMFCGSTAVVALVREEPVDEGEVYLPEEIADRRKAEQNLPESEVKRIHLEDGRVLVPVLYVANAGDCRAVLSRSGRAIDLSEDHKPSSAEEKARIEEAGGWVHNGRLHGVLGVARAFGDAEHKHLKEKSWGKEFKADPLTADPDVHVEAVGPRDEFLVLACDGLWDVMSSQQAVNYVRRCLRRSHDLQEAAEGLVSKAIARNSADNVSVIVVAFNQRWCAPGMGSFVSTRETAQSAGTPKEAAGGSGGIASSADGADSGGATSDNSPAAMAGGGGSDSDSDSDEEEGLEEW